MGSRRVDLNLPFDPLFLRERFPSSFNGIGGSRRCALQVRETRPVPRYPAETYKEQMNVAITRTGSA